jgi:membrane fusion protein, peptide pheromone/bacteriocin exporter
MLTPLNHIPPTTHRLLFQTSRRILFVYFLIITIFTAIIASLPFLYVDISVVAPGIVRPSDERTEVKSAAAGFISLLKYREGDFVEKDSMLAALEQHHLVEKSIQLEGRIREIHNYIADLKLLISRKSSSPVKIQALKTELYRQQLISFNHRVEEHDILLKSSNEELLIKRYLNAEKIISRKELFDSEIADEKIRAAFNTLNTIQKLAWEKELATLQSEYNELLSKKKEVSFEARDYQLMAPVSGTIQYITARYPGSYVQPGETVCIISPESQLLAECIVSGKDIALVQASRKVTFRFDAFNYSYFGIVTGKILSVDKDFTVVDNKPVFKVRCNFDKLVLPVSNGFKGNIQKGLTLHASFVLTRRSLWQLLYDKAGDWINPNNHTLK